MRDDDAGEEGYTYDCDYYFDENSTTIDLDDLFIVEGINDEDDILEMDPEFLSSFQGDSGDFGKQNYMTSDYESTLTTTQKYPPHDPTQQHEHEHVHVVVINPPTPTSSKNAQAGKRKVKVEWTGELHRRFVEAVEQLGVDKAVPSRILELMGSGGTHTSLTRHNIASHLQKYRSHRKHLLAREAESTNWKPAEVVGGKRDIMNTWHVPAIGFPHFRPLHVWGHPSINQSLMNVWPKHLGPSPSPPLSWAQAAPPPPTPAPPDPSLWNNSHLLHVPNSFTLGKPCFPSHLVHATYPVPGIPPPTMYTSVGVSTPLAGQALSQPPRPLDFHPSKESIDAALGDVMSKPWLPLPLGLKPPSVDGVMVELQRHGVPKIPPAALSLQ